MIIQLYESLSEDRADLEENKNENIVLDMESSVQLEKPPKGSKKKLSKAWDTFDHISSVRNVVIRSLTIHRFEAENMLRHKQTCTRS